MFHALAQTREGHLAHLVRVVLGLHHLAADERDVGTDDGSAEQQASVPAGRHQREVAVTVHSAAPVHQRTGRLREGIERKTDRKATGGQRAEDVTGRLR